MKIFTEEALTSFNVYQLFACIVWYFRDYRIYALIILLFVIGSIVFQVLLVRGEQKKINSMADSSLVTVFRKKKDKLAMRDAYYEDKVDSTRLVPGDIIYINPDEKVPCDLILLDGQALIDESLLTGESVPMLKTPVPRNEALFSDQNKEYIIYAGTYAITSVSSTNKDQPAKAMVFQIGFGTTKGRLIRSIMFNDPAMYRFERDSNYFTLYLFMIAVLLSSLLTTTSALYHLSCTAKETILQHLLPFLRHRSDDGPTWSITVSLYRN
jgi:magnesium-transporting ATPase (P-type)